MSCPGHRGYDDFRLRKKIFDPLDERDRADYFSDTGSMDPNWLFKGEAREEPRSLDQFLSKSLLEEAPEEEIGGREDEKATEESIVKLVNHQIIAKVQISKHNFSH
jgi:hypothetical protein